MKFRNFLQHCGRRLFLALALCIVCAAFAPFGPSSVPASLSAAVPAASHIPAYAPPLSGIRMPRVPVSADFARGQRPVLPQPFAAPGEPALFTMKAAVPDGAPQQLMLLRPDGFYRFCPKDGQFKHADDPFDSFALTLPPVHLDVEPIFQDELLLPNGCESVSLAMLMQFHGIAADAYDFTMRCVPHQEIRRIGEGRFAPNPNQAYIGDPSAFGSGWYCFEDPVIEGANRYLAERGAAFSAEKISGADYVQLWYALYTGHPAAVWLTVDYTPPRRNPNLVFTLPDGKRYRPYRNLHCLILTGMEGDRVFLSDPKRGKISIPRDQFFTLYNAMGRRAVILDPVP